MAGEKGETRVLKEGREKVMTLCATAIMQLNRTGIAYAVHQDSPAACLMSAADSSEQQLLTRKPVVLGAALSGSP